MWRNERRKEGRKEGRKEEDKARKEERRGMGELDEANHIGRVKSREKEKFRKKE